MSRAKGEARRAKGEVRKATGEERRKRRSEVQTVKGFRPSHLALRPPLMLLVFFAAAVGVLQAESMTLDQLLNELERRGSTLTSMSAQITQKKWTDILDEFDAGESGRFLFLRRKGEIYLRKDIQTPQANHLVIRKGEVIFYQPAIKQAQKHDLGQNRDRAEFLLLGFGTSRKTLEETYQTRLLGHEVVGASTCYLLELTPRSKEVSAYFKTIVLWVDSRLWVPVQQKLVEPTDDYLLVRFDQIELNPKVSISDFELKLPKDVKFVGAN